MDDYKENSCRLCPKVFCCKGCREKHEVKTHGAFPKCDICILGFQKVPDPTDTILLNHIFKNHGGLHCVFCKEKFLSPKDLIACQNKCPVGFTIVACDSPKSPFTPGRSGIITHQKQSDYEINLITSTPMQQSEEVVFEKIEQLVTPVDYLDSKDNNNLVKIKSIQTSENSSKRKVTFSDTPIIDINKKHKNTSILKKQSSFNMGDMSKKSVKQSSMEEYLQNNKNPSEGSNIEVTPSISNTFYSVREELSNEIEGNESKETENKENSSKNSSGNTEFTNYESACVEFTTPLLSKNETKGSDTSIIQTADTSRIQETEENKDADNETLWESAMNTTLSTPHLPQKQQCIVLPIQKHENNNIVEEEHITNDIQSPTEEYAEELDISTSSTKSEPKEFSTNIDPTTPISSTKISQSPTVFDASTATDSDESDSNFDTKPSLNPSNKSVFPKLSVFKSDTSLWSSVRELVKKSFKSSTAMKRSLSDYDVEAPQKRRKVYDVKCRPSIRDAKFRTSSESCLPVINFNNISTENVAPPVKKFVDKATQTDPVTFL